MVSRDEVLRIARLAKLALTPDEESTLGPQLLRILEYVEQLRELDSEDIRAEVGVSAAPALRADVPAPGLSREEALALAPAHDGQTFLVPAVIDPGSGA